MAKEKRVTAEDNAWTVAIAIEETLTVVAAAVIVAARIAKDPAENVPLGTSAGRIAAEVMAVRDALMSRMHPDEPPPGERGAGGK